MAVRVHELARELGVESKIILSTLKDMGEYVKSASSSVEAPVVRRLKEEHGDALRAQGSKKASSKKPAAPAESATSQAPTETVAPDAGQPTVPTEPSEAVTVAPRTPGPRPGPRAPQAPAEPEVAPTPEPAQAPASSTPTTAPISLSMAVRSRLICALTLASCCSWARSLR